MWEAEAEKMREDQQEQKEKLSELIDKVNDQARLVGEMQQSNLASLLPGSLYCRDNQS